MSKIFISYRAFPNCYEATQYSKNRAGMSHGLRSLGALLIILCCSVYEELLSFLASGNLNEEFVFRCIILLCILAFEFYAFIWRTLQVNYGLKLIFINEAYRKLAVYGDQKRSEEFVRMHQKIRDSEKKEAKIDYQKAVIKAAIIYSACVLLVLVILTIILID